MAVCDRYGISRLGRLLRSRQRGRARVFVVAESETDGYLLQSWGVCTDVRLRAERCVSRGAPQCDLRAARDSHAAAFAEDGERFGGTRSGYADALPVFEAV